MASFVRGGREWICALSSSRQAMMKSAFVIGGDGGKGDGVQATQRAACGPGLEVQFLVDQQQFGTAETATILGELGAMPHPWSSSCISGQQCPFARAGFARRRFFAWCCGEERGAFKAICMHLGGDAKAIGE